MIQLYGLNLQVFALFRVLHSDWPSWHFRTQSASAVYCLNLLIQSVITWKDDSLIILSLKQLLASLVY